MFYFALFCIFALNSNVCMHVGTLAWLPLAELPPHVALLLSCLDHGTRGAAGANAPLQLLRARLGGAAAGCLVALPPPTRDDAAAMLAHHLAGASRSLTEQQLGSILDGFERGTDASPLFVRVAFVRLPSPRSPRVFTALRSWQWHWGAFQSVWSLCASAFQRVPRPKCKAF